MKTICLVFLCLEFFATPSFAKIFTVDNRAGSTALYKEIDAAIAAAAAGDTIYVQGSEVSYTRCTIIKKLTLIGPGHHPKKQFALQATIGNVYLGTSNATAEGSNIIGLTITSISTQVGLPGNDISIKRCKISQLAVGGTSASPTRNWIIENNVIGNLVFSVANAPSNFVVHNNIFDGMIGTANSIFLTNNIFVRAVSSAGTAFSNVTDSNIQNNIFYGPNPSGANNSTFNNNITYKTPATELPYGTNIGSGNILNTNPQFVSFPADGATFGYQYDFHLQENSPAKAKGINGDDIGVYSGIGFSETGEPPIPQVREFLIKNAVVAPNGKLLISVKAEAKN